MGTSGEETTTEDNSPNANFDKFMLAEYTNIAQAYFNMVSTISSFFQYYVLIISFLISAPLSAAAAFLKPDTLIKTTHLIASVASDHKVALLIIVGSLYGALLSMTMYLMNLRFDAILYARTVNGIRNYFFDNCTEPPTGGHANYLVLPRSTKVPPYFEWNYGLFVLATMAILNSLVIGAGLWVCAHIKMMPYLVALIVAVLGFLAHFFVYWRLTIHRES